MEILIKEKWLRLVKMDGYHKVQVKSWFKWKDVTFGPYGPHPVGITLFKNREIIEENFMMGLSEGKSYTKRGISY